MDPRLPEDLTDPRLKPSPHKTCPRCIGTLTRETRSFFTNEVICVVCNEKELKIRSELANPGIYEEIGFVPKVG